MNKQETLAFLDQAGVEYELTEHPAAFTVEQMDQLDLPHPEAGAKNLFLRDNRKRTYCLLTCRDHKRVDLKAFAAQNGLRRLQFASADDLRDMLGLIPGSVTPLGLLNDADRRVVFYLDDDFTHPGELIGVHPNQNTATVWMQGSDLLRIVREHGNQTHVVKI